MNHTKQLFVIVLVTSFSAGALFFLFKIPEQRAKIIILTSTGGGGHLAVSNTLVQQLQKKYTVETINVFKDLLRPLDPLHSLTGYSGEELYNSFVPSNSFKILSLFYYIGGWFMQLNHKNIEKLLHNYFINSKPSVIISVIPLINNIILTTCQKLNIPFILIPTDLNIEMYIRSIKNFDYEKFTLCLPFDDPKIIAPLKDTNISDNQIAFIGAPIKESFFAAKNKSTLKKKFNIPENKPIIMLLMGAQGLQEIEKYTAELIKLEQPAHIIICYGKNEKSKDAIEKLTIPEHISISLVGFTPYIAEYMAMADLFITKSGTLSVCEAIYSHLPMLLDATNTILPWEKFNHTFIKEHGFGQSIKHYSMIVPTVSSLLSDNSLLNEYKKNLELFKKTHDTKKIKRIIQQMLK